MLTPPFSHQISSYFSSTFRFACFIFTSTAGQQRAAGFSQQEFTRMVDARLKELVDDPPLPSLALFAAGYLFALTCGLSVLGNRGSIFPGHSLCLVG